MKCFPQNCESYFSFFPSAGLLGSSCRPSLLFPSCGCGMKHLAELELGYSFLLSRCLYMLILLLEGWVYWMSGWALLGCESDSLKVKGAMGLRYMTGLSCTLIPLVGLPYVYLVWSHFSSFLRCHPIPLSSRVVCCTVQPRSTYFAFSSLFNCN